MYFSTVQNFKNECLFIAFYICVCVFIIIISLLCLCVHHCYLPSFSLVTRHDPFFFNSLQFDVSLWTSPYVTVCLYIIRSVYCRGSFFSFILIFTFFYFQGFFFLFFSLFDQGFFFHSFHSCLNLLFSSSK